MRKTIPTKDKTHHSKWPEKTDCESILMSIYIKFKLNNKEEDYLGAVQLDRIKTRLEEVWRGLFFRKNYQ